MESEPCSAGLRDGMLRDGMSHDVSSGMGAVGGGICYAFVVPLPCHFLTAVPLSYDSEWSVAKGASESIVHLVN